MTNQTIMPIVGVFDHDTGSLVGILTPGGPVLSVGGGSGSTTAAGLTDIGTYDIGTNNASVAAIKATANAAATAAALTAEAATARAAEVAAQNTANAAIPSSQKGANSGVATLDSGGKVPVSQLPNPSATTLGGVQSVAAVANKYVTSISTSGVPALAQPVCADLSDLASVITTPIANNTAALTVQTTNPQSGTTYTFVLGDAGVNVDLNNAASITATIPPHSSVAYPLGTILPYTQAGAGVVTIAAGAGVTLTKRATYSYSTSEQLATGYAQQVTQDNWRVYNG